MSSLTPGDCMVLWEVVSSDVRLASMAQLLSNVFIVSIPQYVRTHVSAHACARARLSLHT